MFENPGKKIKYVAVVVCWAGIIVFVIVGIALFVSGSNLSRHYAAEDIGSTLMWSGFGVAVIGSLISWVSALMVAGFGELIASQQRTEMTNAEILKRLNGMPAQTEKEGVAAPATFDDLPNL